MKRGTEFTDAQKEEIGKRISELAVAINASKADIARACDVSRRMPANWMDGTSVPKEPRIRALADFLNTTPEFIYYGDQSTQLQNNVNVIDQTFSGAGVSAFTVFNILKEALYSVNEESEGDVGENGAEQIFVSREWLQRHNAKPDYVCAYEVQDSIQNPPLMPGSVVLIDTADTTVVDDRLYAVDQGGLIRIWRVFHRVGGYRLVSPNSDYPDETADAENTIICGCVIRSYSPSLR